MNKALITGGAGFIGSHLGGSLLSHGYEVHLVDNFARGVSDATIQSLRKAGAVLHERDLLDARALDHLPCDFGAVFHFAAIIGVQNVLDRPYAVLRDNVLMTEHLIQFCKRLPQLTRVVFASTSEVYAGTLKFFELPIPTPESTPLGVTDLAHPRTSYMLSKIYGEALCHQSGLPFTIIRPHNVYGPRMGMSHVVPELFKKAYAASEGAALDVYSPDHRRTFCYVSDAVEVIRLAAFSEACRGQTLNVGSERPEVTMRDLAERIIEITGRSLAIRPLEETAGSPLRRCPDMTLTCTLTGYQPSVGLDTGLRATLDWYRPTLALPAGGR